MTKRDFLNALMNPTHAEIKVKLRTLRKELRAANWKLNYRFDKKTSAFYLSLYPTAVSKKESNDIMRLLKPLAEVSNSQLDSEQHRHGHIYADIWLFDTPRFLV